MFRRNRISFNIISVIIYYPVGAKDLIPVLLLVLLIPNLHPSKVSRNFVFILHSLIYVILANDKRPLGKPRLRF